MKLRLSPPQALTEQGKNKWLFELYKRIGDGPFMLRGYTVTSLPPATDWGDGTEFSSLVFVSNETGGAVLAFSDGTNWRRVTDRAIVS